jgi:Ran GTPase-activating protein (RanGAP) involved in mRNA processing and transport
LARALGVNHTLAYINLAKNNLGDMVSVLLRQLQKRSNLQSLDLADNDIQEHHAKLFFHLVSYTRILSLSLEKNFIKSETLLEIKKAMGANR